MTQNMLVNLVARKYLLANYYSEFSKSENMQRYSYKVLAWLLPSGESMWSMAPEDICPFSDAPPQCMSGCPLPCFLFSWRAGAGITSLYLPWTGAHGHLSTPQTQWTVVSVLCIPPCRRTALQEEVHGGPWWAYRGKRGRGRVEVVAMLRQGLGCPW